MAFLTFLNHITAQQPYQKFPELKAKNLNQQKVTFPDDLNDKINILILVFKEEAQQIVDSWAKMIIDEYEPRKGFSYHEIPMISSWYYPIAWQIDNWMRDGIPTALHDNTVTFYGNRKPYYEALNMKDKDSCYLFILDENGFIRFRISGVRTLEKEAAFRTAITSLLH